MLGWMFLNHFCSPCFLNQKYQILFPPMYFLCKNTLSLSHTPHSVGIYVNGLLYDYTFWVAIKNLLSDSPEADPEIGSVCKWFIKQAPRRNWFKKEKAKELCEISSKISTATWSHGELWSINYTPFLTCPGPESWAFKCTHSQLLTEGHWGTHTPSTCPLRRKSGPPKAGGGCASTGEPAAAGGMACRSNKGSWVGRAAIIADG